MDFILNEATKEEDNYLSSSDSEYFSEEQQEFDDFIDDSNNDTDLSIYRQVEYFKFSNQTKNPITTLNKEREQFFGKNENQPELFEQENPERIDFDLLDGDKNTSEVFEKSLQNFKNSDKTFFNAFIYGISYSKLKAGETLVKYEQILGDKLRLELIRNQSLLKLDHSISIFFKCCQTANEFYQITDFFKDFLNEETNTDFKLE